MNDFNAAFVSTGEGRGLAADAVAQARVRDQAERARRALSTQASATLSVVYRDHMLEHTVSAERFEQLSAKLLERLREPVVRALRDGKIVGDTLKEIVLVGGATRMPVVRRAVTRMFGRFPGAGPNPDEAIAIGAAIQAGLKARDAALKDMVMTDVCPYTLGVDTAERRADSSIAYGVFSPIIERNTVVPASRVKQFSTMHDDQRQVVFKIYQGESRKVEDNIPLGKIEIPVPPQRAGSVSVDVRFSYDINGLLEVDVKVPGTGETRQLVIVDEETDLNSAEMKKRREALASLKVHPRESDENRVALARGARCYEQFLGTKRELVGQLIGRFESVLDAQEPNAIAHAREEFMKALDGLDGDSYL
jgi:molecular chaperone HscC